VTVKQIKLDKELSKIDRYDAVSKEILAVVDGELNLITRMATVSCLLHMAFDSFYWTGFYMVDPDRKDHLIVGPYQGTLGCLRIPFGKGVCGTAAASRKTQIIDDVNVFSGHIACDVNTNSEIVVPVYDGQGDVIAVLDIDATDLSAFDETDGEKLEALVKAVFAN
jgi:GAF domain-containing protein